MAGIQFLGTTIIHLMNPEPPDVEINEVLWLNVETVPQSWGCMEGCVILGRLHKESTKEDCREIVL